MAGGWIKKHRASVDHPAVKGFVERGVWDYLLLKAAHRQATVPVGPHVVDLKRGQVALSVLRAAEEGGISHKRLRTILAKFEAMGMVTLGKGKGKAFTLITIVNYERYQDVSVGPRHSEAGQGQTDGQTEGKRKANRGANIEQEDKNLDSPPSPNGLVPPAGGDPKPKRERKKPVRSLPADFGLTPERGAYLAQQCSKLEVECPDPAGQIEEFRDHHAAKGAMFADWEAAWRKWARNAAKFQAERAKLRVIHGGRHERGGAKAEPTSADAALYQIRLAELGGRITAEEAAERRRAVMARRNGTDG